MEHGANDSLVESSCQQFLCWMFRAELELTDFMDTKSVTGYKLCKWLTITVKGKWNDPFFIPPKKCDLPSDDDPILTCRALPSARSCRWTWSTAAASCWHRPRDPEASAVLLFSISSVISDIIPWRLSVLSYLEMATTILCQRFLQFQTWSSLVSQICLIQYSRVLYHFCTIWKSENNYNQ